MLRTDHSDSLSKQTLETEKNGERRPPEAVERTVMFIVKYHVSGYESEYQTEAYETYERASEHLQDIAGYEGVHSARIVLYVDEGLE